MRSQGTDVSSQRNLATTLGEMIRDQAKHLGNKPAMRDNTRIASYADLFTRAQQLAALFNDTLLGEGRRVAYFGKNTIEYYEILLGCAMAGVVLVPINFRLTDVETAWQIEDARAQMLFLDVEFAARQESLLSEAKTLKRVIIIGEADQAGAGQQSYDKWLANAPQYTDELEVDPEDIVVQLYTSGTTGNPKGAMLSHRALLVFRNLPYDEQPAWQRWEGNDVGMIVMPQFHIGGTGFGMQLLCSGAMGLIVRDFNTSQVLRDIEKYRLTKLFTVPAALRMILDDPMIAEVDHSSLRTILYGASPIAPDLLARAISVFNCDFVQQYGMTELCGTICVLDQDDHKAASGEAGLLRSAGRPLKGVDLAILDDCCKSLPPYKRGEIAIRTPTIMSGYWQREEASAACMTADGFFLTGDVGHLDERGYLFVSDRLKDMIISGGENVYPAEVEAALSEHAAISDIAIIGVPDSSWGEAVKAVVVIKEGATLDHKSLVKWGRERLAGYKLPKSTEFVTSLPRSATGKVLRRKLRKLHESVSGGR